MPKVTLLARLSDGLPLVAAMADEKDAYAKELETYERQAKKLVRTLASSAPERAHTGKDEYVTVESGTHFCFHYVMSGGVVILTLTEKAYPKRLAFDYLDELRKEFFKVTVHKLRVRQDPKPSEIKFGTQRRAFDHDKNINDVISRGERLENVAQKSTRLAQESKRYTAQAKHANRMRVVRQYAPIGIVFVIVCFVWWLSRKIR